VPKRLVVVNVAAFEIYYFENDAIVWQNRAQVGREVSQTPQYRDDTQYLVLNPYVLRQDPGPNNALGAVKTIYLDDPVPVMLLYWTVAVAKGGPVEFSSLTPRDARAGARRSWSSTARASLSRKPRLRSPEKTLAWTSSAWGSAGCP